MGEKLDDRELFKRFAKSASDEQVERMDCRAVKRVRKELGTLLKHQPKRDHGAPLIAAQQQ
jgi:hypothetical protein